MIEKTIDKFYQIAINDILIGYHFKKIPDFTTHLPRIYAFWRKILLDEPSEIFSSIDLLRAHLPLHIKKAEVRRWGMLFTKVLEDELKDNPELKIKWQKKIEEFVEIFLNNKKFYLSSMA
jgi:hypothetical protein